MLLSSIKSLITLADIILLKASQYYLVLLKEYFVFSLKSFTYGFNTT